MPRNWLYFGFLAIFGYAQASFGTEGCVRGPTRWLQVSAQKVPLCRGQADSGHRLVWASGGCQAAQGLVLKCAAVDWLNQTATEKARLRDQFSKRGSALPGGANPAAAYCEFLGGKPDMAKDLRKNELGICIAKDKSFVLSWELYSSQ